ncbi:hypothetical protein [Bradyrhizobium sp. CCBAU 51627]|uniref:hypothetical protein n=1 Tax=Bradyrhizobium sp. CCBAU 51627 TaxID=1325088 RepID=UPI002305BCEA|nr:hypothetical protein [Bradyrhizobium sp. CCBAU 51627]
MRSEAHLWRSTTVSLVASNAANSADLGPAVKILQGLWSWTGESIGVLFGGDDDRKSFSDYGPSIYRNIIDSPVFLQDDQIGYKRARRGGVPRPGEDFCDDVLFNDRALSSAVLSGFSVGPLTPTLIGTDVPLSRSTNDAPFPMTLLSCLVLPCVNLDGGGPRCECGRIAP